MNASFFDVHCRNLQLDPMLHGVCAGFESGAWRAKQLSHYLMEWLPEFCLSFSEHESIKGTNAVSQLRAAAQTVYDTDKYDRRGEFGELLLHALLRETKQTQLAISKISSRTRSITRSRASMPSTSLIPSRVLSSG